MGVDTDCVVVVAVVITAYGAMVDTAETTMEGGDSKGGGGLEAFFFQVWGKWPSLGALGL